MDSKKESIAENEAAPTGRRGFLGKTALVGLVSSQACRTGPGGVQGR
ncbi:hypothetical protein LP420_13025 [Massilia sp. B-10]|nr:hypothetical protein LP420_13025 [Massilia sp. B-10]